MIWGLLIVFLVAKTGVPANRKILDKVARNYLPGYHIECQTIESANIAICKKDEIIRYFVLSRDFCTHRGFNGTSNLGILFKEDCSVDQVWIVTSPDTRQYVNRIKQSGFLQQFKADDGKMKLITVTGATITSQAMISTVRDVRNAMLDIIPKIH